MSRRDAALNCIDITQGTGLELGPLFDPLVFKSEANVSYLDHMSTEDLKKKYDDHPIKGHPIPLDKLAPVDYVLQDNSLKRTLKGKRFDYVIASHVMEHIPDLVSWLADVEAILADDGILSLVIPDKRFTFDILRNESRPADVIGAYLDKHVKTSSVAMYDYMSNFRHKVVAAEVWQNPHEDYSRKPKNPRQRVYDICLENTKPETYVDAHCFVFTPYSFFEIIRELIKYELFGYEIVHFQDTPENQLEFYVSLRKSKQPRAKKLRSVPRLRKPPQKHELHKEITRLEAEMERQTAALKAELHNIKRSKSWKITKPIRRATKLYNKFAKGEPAA